MNRQLYEELYRTILEEHKKVFEKQDLDELETVMTVLKEAKRIFILGVGREGIAARAFAMRLMHLGKTVHWIWDDTTPGMHKDDLCMIVNGSGKIGHLDYVTRQAKKAQAKTLVVTGSPGEEVHAVADCILFIPAHVFNGTDKRAVPSMQPMGNLFEQHAFLLYDMLIMMLEREMKLSHDEMEERHRNVE